jgi:hypothetical protein
MSVYFVIPNSFTGTGDQEISLDNNFNITRQKKERINEFGDNYFSSIPLGPGIRIMQGSLSNRPTTEIDLVESYFNSLAGELVNGLVVDDVSIDAVVERFNKNYLNGEVYSLGFTLREVKR